MRKFVVYQQVQDPNDATQQAWQRVYGGTTTVTAHEAEEFSDEDGYWTIPADECPWSETYGCFAPWL